MPEPAWLEGLVNAVVHRSYSVMGDHTRVDIFDDRIEIESPGRFPGLADPSTPLAISRFARNPRIARVCADLRFGQELGEGIRRMFEEMRLAGLTAPVYSQTSGSARLMLSCEAVDKELEASATGIPRDRANDSCVGTAEHRRYRRGPRDLPSGSPSTPERPCLRGRDRTRGLEPQGPTCVLATHPLTRSMATPTRASYCTPLSRL